MCVRAGFALLWPSKVSTSDEVSSCLEVLDRRYSMFFFLKTCVFISSLLLIKSPQRAMTWCDWKRVGVWRGREEVLHIRHNKGARGSIILDRIRHGEKESIKVYFSREIWNVWPENKASN